MQDRYNYNFTEDDSVISTYTIRHGDKYQIQETRKEVKGTNKGRTLSIDTVKINK